MRLACFLSLFLLFLKIDINNLLKEAGTIFFLEDKYPETVRLTGPKPNEKTCKLPMTEERGSKQNQTDTSNSISIASTESISCFISPIMNRSTF